MPTEAPPQGPVVRMDSLRKTFPATEAPALDGVSGCFEAGTITGIVGPDGAGKTTLLRMVAGLVGPDSGSVRVLGLDPVSDADALKPLVGYMPQKFGLYEDLSVIENLVFHADLRGVRGAERREAFDRLLAFTSLAPFTARLAGALSGGMKQKLGLACALLGSPRLLLLDEPGVGVDPISRRELWAMVRALAGKGMAVAWSTSYMDDAGVCDKVLLLDGGRMLFDGPPAGLTRRLAGRCLLLRGVDGAQRAILRRALDLPAVSDGAIQGSHLRVTLREGATRLDPAALDAGPGAHWVDVAPRFEDAFIDLLGGGPGGRSPLAEAMPMRNHGIDSPIVAESLTRRFGDFTAADRITFAVRPGEIFGLLGPNGAGKSTTFKMLCGLLRPSDGRARVMGLDLAHSPGKARQRIGYMAQKFSLYGNLTVRDNLEFFAGAYGLHGGRRSEAIRGMLDAFHLGPYLGMKAGEMPPGFKQRLSLACATMHEPDILFLDEPTSGVDPITRREFWNHINGMVGKGVTIMVTTHFMDEAEYCDRIGFVYRGSLIALAPPDEVKARVASAALPDPSMEDAFIELVRRHDADGSS